MKPVMVKLFEEGNKKINCYESNYAFDLLHCMISSF